MDKKKTRAGDVQNSNRQLYHAYSSCANILLSFALRSYDNVKQHSQFEN